MREVTHQPGERDGPPGWRRSWGSLGPEAPPNHQTAQQDGAEKRARLGHADRNNLAGDRVGAVSLERSAVRRHGEWQKRSSGRVTRDADRTAIAHKRTVSDQS